MARSSARRFSWADPARHAKHAVKVLKYHLMEVREQNE